MRKTDGMSDTKPIRIPKQPAQTLRQHPTHHGTRPSQGGDTVRPVQAGTRPPQGSTRSKQAQGGHPSRRSAPPIDNPPYDERLEVPPHHPSHPKKKRRKRPRRPVGCCLGQAIVFAIFFVFVLYSSISLYAIGKLQKEETGTRAMRNAAVYADASVRNILLIGSDSRTEERGRADSMIILSVSSLNHTITMTSVMRDSYVSIPGHGTDKLNAAFAYGGATLLMDTIQNNYCIALDDYICINFQAMAAITDAVGGVTITLTDREAQAVNEILQSEVNALMGDDPMSDFLPSGGTYVLSGKQALSYARIRYVGNADFERTERQRTVLTQLMQNVKQLSPSAIPALMQDALPTLSTNLSTAELYLWSWKLPYLLASYELQTLRLPADGTYSDQTTQSGAMVLAVDFDANLTLFKDAVQNPLEAEEGGEEAP